MDTKLLLERIRIIILIILGVYSFLMAIGVRLQPYSKRLGLLLLGFVIILATPLINEYLEKRTGFIPETNLKNRV